MRSILVVSDLTPGSEAALRAGGRIAEANGGALHVFHGAGLIGLTLREALPRLAPGVAEARAGALEEQLRAAAPRHAHDASRHIDPRTAHDGVVARARQVGATLIVLPAELSSADRIVARALAASTPVLVVGEGDGAPFERVLVPLGSDEITSRTLRSACEWLHPLEISGTGTLAEVHVLHVCRTLREWRCIGERFQAKVRATEREVRRMTGVFHRHVRWARVPWREIVLAAREVGAELIVLRPCHPAAEGEERTWRGVVDQARCSVLLLPSVAGPDAPRTVTRARPRGALPELVPAGRD